MKLRCFQIEVENERNVKLKVWYKHMGLQLQS
jgi:hypothetical protein